ncbi:DNA (Cytosine-5)-methyltransferase DRM1/2 isoform 2 [Hibiscus syriacus]|uniref:DNA (Cytosine-5)-methyltransferase DRM1/2 isoform 2 n=1 Tax=Hibiscus syriacus TaxID=106335 RepID=A0A6A3CQI2_HIBSY|nr:DNA (Cytosine-5)-methyltransferase DRM1/2 isoform 2 [Hibiscus syriacus]
MQHVNSDNNSSDYEAIFQDDFTDIDSSSDIEKILNSDSDEENKLLYLTKMGYSEAEASIAMKRCGLNSSIAELTDFICVVQISKAADALLLIEDRNPLCNDLNYKKRQNSSYDFWERNKQKKLEKKLLNEEDHAVHLLIPMIGSGVSTEPDQITQRTLSEDATGSPYLYYEKVALAPKGSVRLLKLMTMSHPRVSRSMFLMSVENGICDAEIDFYCLGIPLKTDVQELNDDRLEQLMSRFVEFDLFKSSEGHNGYHLGIEEVAIMYQDLSQHHGITRVQESVTSSILHTFWLLGPLAFKKVKCFIILVFRNSLSPFVNTFATLAS